jgi:hypothetical protein
MVPGREPLHLVRRDLTKAMRRRLGCAYPSCHEPAHWEELMPGKVVYWCEKHGLESPE